MIEIVEHNFGFNEMQWVLTNEPERIDYFLEQLYAQMMGWA